MGTPLTQEAFDLWRGEHDKRIETVLHVQAQQIAVNASVDRRLSVIETHREIAVEQAATRINILSALVSAVVGGMAGWLAPK